MNEVYKTQVKLLLEVLPEVAKEQCFAMHGGTAINLFVQNMPRLSVDIDLTYVEISARDEALIGINSALLRIKDRVEALRPSLQVSHKENVCKLQVSENGVIIKVEVNMVGRGLLSNAVSAPLCETAQEQFDVFCVVPLVPIAQLYGGKICAALDRQHPRDMFDVKLLLDNDDLTGETKLGLIYGLVSSNRPTHEMLDPNLLDQSSAFVNQFEGMSGVDFSYEDFEQTRLLLIGTIKSCLAEEDKDFLLRFNKLSPDWSVYDFQNYPSVRWKLLNLQKFKTNNPDLYNQQLNKLSDLFGR
ncbi:nucleotidyl transferase AbiEii/AbiGii toxin family protein [Pseudomaricurvus alkylphenolicus]|jgi:hypothetical protein|uniref:nucleotidyl transferase AbiEii/AbiGii toxin family protein n=1 Tax=Pseudomaricurvus alkylphenolicus TaxID=1306991 RepID=UPI00141EB42E|nr:nucleotidyl transferase AbiEii/AbiGii toxin family protein [Pseudomaricurvus alkylphenolicus]NIB38847.1 nucleotidyl transferase AbiEii/AbiGii toxin family protein [Pseudomaricurvus alkylphenolicus]